MCVYLLKMRLVKVNLQIVKKLEMMNTLKSLQVCS